MEGGHEGEGGVAQCACQCNCAAGPESCDCLCNCPLQAEQQLDILSLVVNSVTAVIGEDISQVLGMVWSFLSSMLGGLREMKREEAVRSVTKVAITMLNMLVEQLQKRLYHVM